MGWTAPRTWVVGEIETAAIFNPHIRDNLLYLHGDAGAIALVNKLAATSGAAEQEILLALSGGAGNYAGISVGRTAGEARWAIPASAGQFFAGAAAGDALFKLDDSAKKFIFGSGSNETLSIRPSTDSLPIAVTGGGGGFLMLSHNAVAGTIITLAVAGTVTVMATMWGMIRNNGGATLAFLGLISANTFQLGTTLVVNCNSAADQVTITVTAGGAITAQRTNGANSHAVNIFVVYK